MRLGTDDGSAAVK